MIVSQIAAQSSNRVIGIHNNLPWNIPEDLSYFKEKTKEKIIVMGRKTFESLPKMLPKRFHIIISRNPKMERQENILWVNSLESALDQAKKLIPPWPNEIFIIGGGEIFLQALPYTQRIYLTQIHREYDGDAFFPEFDKNIFKMVSKIKGSSSKLDNQTLQFDYLVFEK